MSFQFALVTVNHTDTCFLKFKRRSLFVSELAANLHSRFSRRVCLCMLARQREVLRNWNLVAPPLPCPTGHAGVWQCLGLFTFQASANWDLCCCRREVHQQIRGPESPLVWLWYNNVFLSEQSQDNKEAYRERWKAELMLRTRVVIWQSWARGRRRQIRGERLNWGRKEWVDKRTFGSWRMLLSLNPSFSLCWLSVFSGPERAAGWWTPRS